MLPTGTVGISSFGEQIEHLEKDLLLQALQHSGGNKKAAAALLRMPLITLHRKIKKYNM